MKRPIDATLRNVKASKKRDDALREAVRDLKQRVLLLERRVRVLEKQ